MAKAQHPTTLSKQFGIPEGRLSSLGILNATLALDTLLFIDPMLLKKSEHPEFRSAHQKFDEHFSQIIRLLVASKTVDDPAWKAAWRRMQFPEIRGTCLGYGAGTIHGRGFTGQLSERTLRVAADIVRIGVEDPDLFPALALFEDNIGPDRLSDMVTNVAFEEIAAFNARMLRELGLKGEFFTFKNVDWEFLRNPFETERTPAMLVPTDVLRGLPIAKDWDGIAAAASHNETLRDAVNVHIGEIWARKTKRDKKRLKEQALSSKEAFETLLQIIKSANGEPYDIENDPDGLIDWAAVAEAFADKYPLPLSYTQLQGIEGVFDVVKEIIDQFRHLVENMGLNKELFQDPSSGKNAKPKHEATAQRLFFAVAYSYCKANNVDVSPEIDTGTGKIDFKFSTGFHQRVLVEIKLSTNSNTVSGCVFHPSRAGISPQGGPAFHACRAGGGQSCGTVVTV